MTEESHLRSYELILTARSPLYIGSGSIRAKTEYLFDPRAGTVRMLDLPKFFEYLVRRGLADQYEKFVFSGSTRVYDFLKDCGFTASDMTDITLYTVSAVDALDDSHSIKEIHSFLRRNDNSAYIPGSSVKGALRTVLLCCMMDETLKGTWPEEQRNKAKKAQQMQQLEGRYLHTLQLKTEKDGCAANDPVNSILRGFSISDSVPIPDSRMILVSKYDAKPNGEIRQIPVCRECVKPGTEIRFSLTLDQSVLRGSYSPARIMERIQTFNEYYKKTYLDYFTPPKAAVSIPLRNTLILGGGSGFFSKNLAYPYLGGADGLDYVADEMIRQFRQHRHDRDVSVYNVSPHTCKYGRYQGGYYPFGMCEVTIK